MMKTKTNSEVAQKRLLSVDVLRGFDMLWIVGGGDVIISFAKAHPNSFTTTLAEHFDHYWGQFHFYDIIMPLFMFIVGVVMPVAFKSRLAKGDTKKEIYRHVLKRVLKLYIIGLIANGHLLQLDINTLHLWTDTLHAIAVGYLVSSLLILECSLKVQVGVTAFLLLAYWAVLALIPVPGYGAGIYQPTINLPLYVDNLILGHFQEGEGWTYILSNMTFVCSVMLGVFAGQILLSKKQERTKAGLLTVIGISCIIVGKIWGIWFPIIHHIWTSTLVLFAGGWSFLFLAFFYLIIDVWGYKKWTFPFVVIGVNAIAVYVANHLFNFKLIGNVFVGGLAKRAGVWNEFVQELGALIVIWLILYWMYKKKTFIKV
jgi:predicted acyltransferase